MKIKLSRSFVILFIIIAMISWGIQKADLPFGDEAGYLNDALLLIKAGKISSNLYLNNYIFLLKYITPDPVTAHILSRFCTSSLSIILMFFFLKSFKCLKNDIVILIVCAFWASCRLNVPYSQFGNINLFCLNILFPSIILIIRKITPNRICFFIFSLFWLTRIRPEYYAPLLLSLLILFGIGVYRTFYNKIQFNKIFNKRYIGSFIFIISIFFSLLFFSNHNSRKININFNEYMLLGLEQCYASLYSKLHPKEKISAMVEYKNITDKVFNKPKTFTDACKKNPIEVIKYLSLNTFLNSVILIPSLLRHRNLFMPESLGKKGEIVELALILIIILFGSLIGLLRLKKKDYITKENILNFLYNYKLLLFLIILSSSSVAILLLIPDARYCISWIPLVFLWIAWSISQIYDRVEFNKITSILSLFIFIAWFCHPFFGTHKSNQLLIQKMRANKNGISKPKVVGLSPIAISIFAFGINVEPRTVYSFKINKIKENIYDFIIIDKYLRNSIFWSKNSQFLSQFEKKPENYGYKFLDKSENKHQTYVYAKK